MSAMQCCQNCTSLCEEEFKQVINLKNSGLLIYLHNKDSVIPTQKEKIEGKRSIILYNSGHKDLKRFDYIADLCQYKIKCLKCKALLKRILCLIENVSNINKNEVVGICEYCKRLPKTNKCKRCEYLTCKFLKNEAKRDLQNKMRVNELITTMRQVFLSLKQGQIICKHNIHLDPVSKMQQNKILKLLNCPVTSRHPNISYLFDFLDDKQKVENNIIGDSEKITDIITKIKSESLIDLDDEDDLSESRSACVCKYLLDDKFKKSIFEDIPIAEGRNRIESVSPKLFETEKENYSGSFIEKLPQLTKTKKRSPKSKQITHTLPISNDKCKNNKYYASKNTTKQKEKGTKLLSDPEKDVILNIIEQRKKAKDERKNKPLLIKSEERSKILDVMPEVETLTLEREVESEKSESVVECIEERPSHIGKMIKGNEIVRYNRHYTHEYDNTEKIPAIFQTQEDSLKLPELNKNKPFSGYSKEGSGVIFYELSNREFIDRGWTKLPTTKIMRKMNIYKMIPSYSKFDWFRNHKDIEILFYHSGEKLAEVHENGCGKWFYKNGKLALDYYSTPELNSQKRCIVYSSDDDTDLKKKKSVNILACFDYLGNGIVYDIIGNVRIKFNQSEGLVIDKKIGPPGRWKWHTLNEPPVLYPVFFNTFLKEPYYEDTKNSINIVKGSDEMIRIELDNLRREKASKLLQEYKSFKIRIKVVKINDYFALRIIDQAKIYLQFRCERICLKLNLGMLLKNKEILDTDIAEVSKVSTPYDYPETVSSNG